MLPAGGVENGDRRAVIAGQDEERLGKNYVVAPDSFLNMFEVGLHMILPGPVLPVGDLHEDEQFAFAAALGEFRAVHPGIQYDAETLVRGEGGVGDMNGPMNRRLLLLLKPLIEGDRREYGVRRSVAGQQAGGRRQPKHDEDREPYH